MYISGSPILQLLRWEPPCLTNFPKAGYPAEAIHLDSLWDSRGCSTLLLLHALGRDECQLLHYNLLDWLLIKNDEQCSYYFFPWSAPHQLFLLPPHQDICPLGVQLSLGKLMLKGLSSYELCMVVLLKNIRNKLIL